MQDITWWGLPAAGLILVLVEAAKTLGFPARYAGVLAIGIGIVGGALAYQFGGSEAAKSAALGLMAGASAAGLWSSTKNVAGK